MKGHTFWNDLKNYKVILLMLLPAVAFFLLFAYIPMAGIVIAFKNTITPAASSAAPGTGWTTSAFSSNPAMPGGLHGIQHFITLLL